MYSMKYGWKLCCSFLQPHRWREASRPLYSRRSSPRTRPSYLWIVSVSWALWKSAASRRISSQSADMFMVLKRSVLRFTDTSCYGVRKRPKDHSQLLRVQRFLLVIHGKKYRNCSYNRIVLQVYNDILCATYWF